MDAICVHLNGKLHIIIDNKGNMILTAEFLQIFGFLKKMLLIQLFFPELNKGHTAVQALLYHLMQSAAVQPVPICHRIKQKIFLIAPHILLPSPASHRPCYRWHR